MSNPFDGFPVHEMPDGSAVVFHPAFERELFRGLVNTYVDRSNPVRVPAPMPISAEVWQAFKAGCARTAVDAPR